MSKRTFFLFLGLPLINLTPIQSVCDSCASRLETNVRPSSLILYTHSGPREAYSFHKKCLKKKCGRKFYHSYSMDMNGEKLFHKSALDKEYFMMTSKIGYESSFLSTTADMIETAALSFTSVCDCYDATHSTEIERQRLEEAYFLHRLIVTNDSSTKVPHRDENDRIDLETLCKTRMDKPRENPYAHHKCDTPGCQEGFVMADGIEKVCIGLFFIILRSTVHFCSAFSAISNTVDILYTMYN